MSERNCKVIEIGKSLGILYSENGTLGIKDYTERLSKHDDAFFNVNCCFYRLVIIFEGFQWINSLFICKLCTHKFLIMLSIHVLSMMQSCIFLHAIMIETCALHQECFITNICLPGVFQKY